MRRLNGPILTADPGCDCLRPGQLLPAVGDLESGRAALVWARARLGHLESGGQQQVVHEEADHRRLLLPPPRVELGAAALLAWPL